MISSDRNESNIVVRVVIPIAAIHETSIHRSTKRHTRVFPSCLTTINRSDGAHRVHAPETRLSVSRQAGTKTTSLGPLTSSFPSNGITAPRPISSRRRHDRVSIHFNHRAFASGLIYTVRVTVEKIRGNVSPVYFLDPFHRDCPLDR